MSYKVLAKVIAMGSDCTAGHRVGDEIVFDKDTVHGHMCVEVLRNCYPRVVTLQFGGAFPWEEEPHVTRVACPDPYYQVIFELRRLESE
ncbi:MAG: TIGR04076 family protein [Chloroflexi bacterium]|nr:TIGR04076 family protein [Chloroflexota bacterium]MCL5075377.1 TIGR04076 family protein [Chloroflexota bacterium]